jgi:hypothetical protein
VCALYVPRLSHRAFASRTALTDVTLHRFEVKLKRPYAGPQLHFVSQHNAHTFNHLNIVMSEPVLTLADAAGAKSTSELSVIIRSSILDQSISLPALRYQKALVGWALPEDGKAVCLSPFITDVDHVKTTHLLIQVVYAHSKIATIVDDTSVANNGLGCYAVLSLAKVAMSSQTFMVVIEKVGQAVGSFACKLNFEWAGEVERDARKLSWRPPSRSSSTTLPNEANPSPASLTPSDGDLLRGTPPGHFGTPLAGAGKIRFTSS